MKEDGWARPRRFWDTLQDTEWNPRSQCPSDVVFSFFAAGTQKPGIFIQNRRPEARASKKVAGALCAGGILHPRPKALHMYLFLSGPQS